MPVRYASKDSGTDIDDSPVLMLSVPAGGGKAKVFSTQVVRAGIEKFGIGSGVPKLHPVVVQSGNVVLSGGGPATGPRLQTEPAQPPSQAPPAAQTSVNRLVAPSGVRA